MMLDKDNDKEYQEFIETNMKNPQVIPGDNFSNFLYKFSIFNMYDSIS